MLMLGFHFATHLIQEYNLESLPSILLFNSILPLPQILQTRIVENAINAALSVHSVVERELSCLQYHAELIHQTIIMT